MSIHIDDMPKKVGEYSIYSPLVLAKDIEVPTLLLLGSYEHANLLFNPIDLKYWITNS